mmetsp:Transcript_26893/g.62791  ORF Transcript_26893/g.62791 Transcript_26893/m.62791 type:complete len:228 (+) Transcript_26893:334-1017(+)
MLIHGHACMCLNEFLTASRARHLGVRLRLLAPPAPSPASRCVSSPALTARRRRLRRLGVVGGVAGGARAPAARRLPRVLFERGDHTLVPASLSHLQRGEVALILKSAAGRRIEQQPRRVRAAKPRGQVQRRLLELVPLVSAEAVGEQQLEALAATRDDGRVQWRVAVVVVQRPEGAAAKALEDQLQARRVAAKRRHVGRRLHRMVCGGEIAFVSLQQQLAGRRVAEP